MRRWPGCDALSVNKSVASDCPTTEARTVNCGGVPGGARLGKGIFCVEKEVSPERRNRLLDSVLGMDKPQTSIDTYHEYMLAANTGSGSKVFRASLTVAT